MKQNRKNKKLQFIRDKNMINAGRVPTFSIFKVSEEIMSDRVAIDKMFSRQTIKGWEKIKKYWRLKWEYSAIKCVVGYANDDYIKQVRTVRITYYK